MSQDEIHAVAQLDTPRNVDVPNSLSGLLIWSFTRFGTSLTVTFIGVAALTIGIKEVYADLAKSNTIVLELVRTQSAASEKLATTLGELAKQVENNTRAIADDRRTGIRSNP